MIPATLTLEQACARTWEAVVVGAGPAGALLARQLTRAGVEVLLADRATFPRPKVCGCCLNAAALDVLDRVGLGTLLAKQEAIPLGRVRLSVSGREAALDIPRGASLCRERFDAALVGTAIDAGADFLPGTAVRLLPSTEAGSRSLRLRQGNEVRTLTTLLVLAADGLSGGLLADEPGHRVRVAPGSRVGAGVTLPDGPEEYKPGTIYMASGDGGYVGIVRLEDGRLDVATALDPDRLRRQGVGKAVAGILNQSGWPGITGLGPLAWRGTPALTRLATPAGHRLLVLGDAAGYVEPFTGEGMAWALASAATLAPLAARAARAWNPSLGAAWGASLNHLLGARRLRCRVVARALRSPALAAVLINLVRWLPWAARPVISSLNRPFAFHLLSPDRTVT
jgi:flavin-dependent dehydrogenase